MILTISFCTLWLSLYLLYVKCILFRSLATFHWILYFLILSFMSCLYVWREIPCEYRHLLNFLHSRLSFSLMMISFAVQMLLKSIRSRLLFLFLFVLILRVNQDRTLLHFMSQRVLLFSLGVPLYLSFYLALYLQFIFVYDGRLQSLISFSSSLLRNLPSVLTQWALRFHPQHQCGRFLCSTPSPGFYCV